MGVSAREDFTAFEDVVGFCREYTGFYADVGGGFKEGGKVGGG